MKALAKVFGSYKKLQEAKIEDIARILLNCPTLNYQLSFFDDINLMI